VPDLNELLERLGRSRSSLQRSVRRTLERERQRLVHARARLDRAPALVLERKRAPLEHLRARLDRAPGLVLERKRASLEHAQGRLGALSPRATLARGYAIVRSTDGVVTSSPVPGTHVDVEVAEGAFGATVD
jgi:exodeoxyribonuclease VII large subunit